VGVGDLVVGEAVGPDADERAGGVADISARGAVGDGFLFGAVVVEVVAVAGREPVQPVIGVRRRRRPGRRGNEPVERVVGVGGGCPARDGGGSGAAGRVGVRR
jgi:hypothetical protein